MPTPSKKERDNSYITLDNIIKTPERVRVPSGRLTRSARRKMMEEEVDVEEKTAPAAVARDERKTASRRRSQPAAAPAAPAAPAPAAVVVEGVDVAIDTLKACVVIAMLVYMMYLVNNIANPSLLPGTVPSIDPKQAPASTKGLAWDALLKGLDPLALLFHFAWCATQMLVVRNNQVACLIGAAAELMNLSISWWLQNTATIDWRVRLVYIAVNFIAIAFGAELISRFAWAGCDTRVFGSAKHSTFVQFELVSTSIKGFLLVKFLGDIIQNLTNYNPVGMNMLCRAMLLSLAFHFSTTELHGLLDHCRMPSVLQLFWNVFFWGAVLLEAALVSVVPDTSGLFKMSSVSTNAVAVAVAFAVVLYGAMASNTPAAVDTVVVTSILCALLAVATAV